MSVLSDADRTAERAEVYVGVVAVVSDFESLAVLLYLVLPPAGALVEALPEDFDTVTLKDGNEYYKVEDTIFKVSVLDGKPYFEVVGQQYS